VILTNHEKTHTREREKNKKYMVDKKEYMCENTVLEGERGKIKSYNTSSSQSEKNKEKKEKKKKRTRAIHIVWSSFFFFLYLFQPLFFNLLLQHPLLCIALEHLLLSVCGLLCKTYTHTYKRMEESQWGYYARKQVSNKHQAKRQHQ
jgi:hypothetical protein